MRRREQYGEGKISAPVTRNDYPITSAYEQLGICEPVSYTAPCASVVMQRAQAYTPYFARSTSSSARVRSEN